MLRTYTGLVTSVSGQKRHQSAQGIGPQRTQRSARAPGFCIFQSCLAESNVHLAGPFKESPCVAASLGGQDSNPSFTAQARQALGARQRQNQRGQRRAGNPGRSVPSLALPTTGLPGLPALP